MKPCSKCRSILLKIRESKLNEYYVVCCGCGKVGWMADTEEEAVERWNEQFKSQRKHGTDSSFQM
ncbi:MAG TPA: hypothetical protein VI911_10335 [Patescibacteria group bacterium]|nr:hypothetical protein [Patescibacteria group bacterium]